MIQNYRISFNQAQRAINNNSHATTNQESFQIGNQVVYKERLKPSQDINFIERLKVESE